MKRTSKLLTVCLLSFALCLCVVHPAFAAKSPATDMVVKVVNTSSEYRNGYWVEYTINGIPYRSDLASEYINQTAFNHMDDDNKVKTIEAFGWMLNERRSQFGSTFSGEMADWYNEKKGWKEASEILNERLAQNNFPEYHERFSNRAAYFENNFEPKDCPDFKNYPELSRLYAQEKVCFEDAYQAYLSMVAAKRLQTNAAVKSISGDLIQLITDRALVPNITPAGTGGIATSISTTVSDYVSSITGATDSLQDMVIGKRVRAADATAVIEQMAVIIEIDKNIIQTCLAEAHKLQNQIENSYQSVVDASVAEYATLDERLDAQEEYVSKAAPFTSEPSATVVARNKAYDEQYEKIRNSRGNYPSDEAWTNALIECGAAKQTYNQNQYEGALVDLSAWCSQWLGSEDGTYTQGSVLGQYVTNYPKRPQAKEDLGTLDMYGTKAQIESVEADVRAYSAQMKTYYEEIGKVSQAARENAIVARRELNRIQGVFRAVVTVKKTDAQLTFEKRAFNPSSSTRPVFEELIVAYGDGWTSNSAPDGLTYTGLASDLQSAGMLDAAVQDLIDYWTNEKRPGSYLEEFAYRKQNVLNMQDDMRAVVAAYAKLKQKYEAAWAEFKALDQQRKDLLDNSPSYIQELNNPDVSYEESELYRLFESDKRTGTATDVSRIAAETDELAKKEALLADQMSMTGRDVAMCAETLNDFRKHGWVETARYILELGCAEITGGVTKFNYNDDRDELDTLNIRSRHDVDWSDDANRSWRADSVRSLRDDFNGRYYAHEKWMETFATMVDNKQEFSTTASADEGGYLELKHEAENLDRTTWSYPLQVVKHTDLTPGEPDPYDDLLEPLIKEIDDARTSNSVPTSLSSSWTDFQISGMVTRKTCTGKPITQNPTITVNGKKLVNNADYKLRYKNNVNVGVATMTVTGMGSYADERTFNFVIDKGSNPMKVSGKTVTVKYSKLKRKNQTVKAAKAFAVTKVDGKTSYTKLSGDKRVIINKKSGLITVKKGMKKDLYKLKVRVSIPESANFYAFAQDVVVKVRVK